MIWRIEFLKDVVLKYFWDNWSEFSLLVNCVADFIKCMNQSFFDSKIWLRAVLNLSVVLIKILFNIFYKIKQKYWNFSLILLINFILAKIVNHIKCTWFWIVECISDVMLHSNMFNRITFKIFDFLLRK